MTENGEKLEIRLDANAIEAILAGSDFLGLLVVGGANGQQTGILTNEGAPLFDSIAPQLTVAYVPEPGSLGAAVVLAAGCLLRRRRSA